MLLSPETHCFAGARHPWMTDVDRRNYARGYKSTSYVPKAPAFMEERAHDACRTACWHAMRAFEVHPKAALAAVHGVNAWCNVKGPESFQTAKAPVGNKTGLTHPALQPADSRPPWSGWRTADLCALPATQEILADAKRWDPWGHRWGRGGHWPLLVSIGRARFRCGRMQKKRKDAKQQKRRQRPEGQGRSGRGQDTLEAVPPMQPAVAGPGPPAGPPPPNTHRTALAVPCDEMRWTLLWRLQRDHWSSSKNAEYERGYEEEVQQAMRDLEEAYALALLLKYPWDEKMPTTYTELYSFVEWARAKVSTR